MQCTSSRLIQGNYSVRQILVRHAYRSLRFYSPQAASGTIAALGALNEPPHNTYALALSVLTTLPAFREGHHIAQLFYGLSSLKVHHPMLTAHLLKRFLRCCFAQNDPSMTSSEQKRNDEQVEVNRKSIVLVIKQQCLFVSLLAIVLDALQRYHPVHYVEALFDALDETLSFGPAPSVLTPHSNDCTIVCRDPAESLLFVYRTILKRCDGVETALKTTWPHLNAFLSPLLDGLPVKKNGHSVTSSHDAWLEKSEVTLATLVETLQSLRKQWGTTAFSKWQLLTICTALRRCTLCVAAYSQCSSLADDTSVAERCALKSRSSKMWKDEVRCRISDEPVLLATVTSLTDLALWLSTFCHAELQSAQGMNPKDGSTSLIISTAATTNDQKYDTCSAYELIFNETLIVACRLLPNSLTVAAARLLSEPHNSPRARRFLCAAHLEVRCSTPHHRTNSPGRLVQIAPILFTELYIQSEASLGACRDSAALLLHLIADFDAKPPPKPHTTLCDAGGNALARLAAHCPAVRDITKDLTLDKRTALLRAVVLLRAFVRLQAGPSEAVMSVAAFVRLAARHTPTLARRHPAPESLLALQLREEVNGEGCAAVLNEVLARERDALQMWEAKYPEVAERLMPYL